uniref:SAM domain-containing protein n=1 Tax=Sinocyclocheilus grahami TaxID=75366 RepID=A0A672RRI7_SINGR
RDTQQFLDKKHADKLYEEDVSGEELVCYQPKHLQELGIKHGPAVKIITRLEKLDTTVENKDNKIIQLGKNSIDSTSKGTPKEDCTSSKETEPTEPADPKTSNINADKVVENEKHMRKSGSAQHSCTLYPFDQNSASHRYIQNYTLPPETGPGNLTDPAHEYKFMGRTDDIHVMKKKFNKEVFRFTAGCMNSRTNGTIHFGVADSKDSPNAHGEIIGVSVDKKDTIIDHFNQGIKSYFEEHTDEAKQCIRQPRFVEVLCADSTPSGKYVIEVDVVPSHSIVQGKLFKIQTLHEDNQWKKSKGKSLFIREGAATRDIYKIGNPRDWHDELTRMNDQINVLDDRRKEAEKRLENKDILLDILCENECENEYDESSAEFEEFKIKTESEFYRGGKVKWWNFYFSEKPAACPFIKRDKHSKLEHMIRSQTKDPTSTCVMLNLFHHPGCGGTTMAMHVMWNLRKEFRCAVLKDNTVLKDEVAKQVAHLMKCGKSEHSLKTPVLLLVEDSEETENTVELQHSLRKFTRETGAFVIILNCIRTKTPKVRYLKNDTESEYITSALSDNEKCAFELKLKQLQEIKSFTTENFYSFMIMKSNLDPEYVANVASNILKDFKVESKQAQLFCILALLNSYVPEPAISKSLCEDFLGIKCALWGWESVLEKMEPYSCLLIEFGAEEYGELKAIRFVHQHLATECVKQLEEAHNCSRADIVLNMLHCDALFKTFAVKDVLVQSMKSMLITRQRKTEDNEKDTLFSPLIEDINSGKDGLNKIQEIFIAASERFNKDFTIPQALARHLYLNEKNFAEAKKWANSAKAIKENSYTVCTVGQVASSELKHKLECRKQEQKPCTAEDLREYLELASTATKAFRRAQTLAKTDDSLETKKELYRKLSPYNISGYMGEIDTAMTVFDIIKKLELFENGDPMKDHYIQSFLKEKMSCANIQFYMKESSNEYVAVLKDCELFLTSLKSQVKEAFDFLEMYFTYMREKGVGNGKDIKNRKKLSAHYQNYISLFCSSAEEKQKERKQKPKLSLNMEIEESRMFLEENRADTFPGLLQFLEDRKETVEMIAGKYSFIHESSAIKTTKDKTNHLLAHIILKLIWPKSKLSKSLEDLSKLLKEILQDVGTQHQYPEPFYLAILLLWPGRNVNSSGIKTYVDKIRSSARKNLSHMYRTRSTIAHFFLGTPDGIQRLVPKVFLDKSIRNVRDRHILWQTGEIFTETSIISKILRVKGTIEDGEVFTEYGNLKIPVRPAFLGRVRSGHSTEKVSFYIGFAMDGPLAYDIQYED